MIFCDSVEQLRDVLAIDRRNGAPIGLGPTKGYLHLEHGEFQGTAASDC